MLDGAARDHRDGVAEDPEVGRTPSAFHLCRSPAPRSRSVAVGHVQLLDERRRPPPGRPPRPPRRRSARVAKDSRASSPRARHPAGHAASGPLPSRREHRHEDSPKARSWSSHRNARQTSRQPPPLASCRIDEHRRHPPRPQRDVVEFASVTPSTWSTARDQGHTGLKSIFRAARLQKRRLCVCREHGWGQHSPPPPVRAARCLRGREGPLGHPRMMPRRTDDVGYGRRPDVESKVGVTGSTRPAATFSRWRPTSSEVTDPCATSPSTDPLDVRRLEGRARRERDPDVRVGRDVGEPGLTEQPRELAPPLEVGAAFREQGAEAPADAVGELLIGSALLERAQRLERRVGVFHDEPTARTEDADDRSDVACSRSGTCTRTNRAC